MSAKIKYNGSVVATVEGGKVATLPVKDLKMATNIEVTEEPIPDKYKDTSNATVADYEVVAGKIFYGATGEGTGKMQAFQGSEMHLFVSSNDPTKINVVIERASAEQPVYLPARTNITGTAVSASSLDGNLKPSNIADGVTIFGVKGEFKVEVWDGTGITIA